jgi:P-type Ca2+ transporter type 2C
VILEDDELRTLIIAIEQGRTIYDNIRKAVRFIMSTNLTEIMYTFTCVASGLGEPLTPMQLLWINLATDVFPELALAAQPPEANVLARPPRDPARPMFTRQDMLRLGTEGLVMTAGTLGAYLFTARRAGPGPLAGTVGFTAITFAQLFHAVSARSETHSIFDREHLAHNRQLPLALGGTALAQIAVSFLPGMRALLGTVPMGPVEWATAIAGALGPFVVNESLKLMRRTGSVQKHDDEKTTSSFVVSRTPAT